MGEGLGCFGFSLDVRIGNDSPTFHTVHLAGLAFFFRDAIGDQATVCTGSGGAYRESLRGLSRFIEVHVAPLGREPVLQQMSAIVIVLCPQGKTQDGSGSVLIQLCPRM
jgi:hypothetical protein